MEQQSKANRMDPGSSGQPEAEQQLQPVSVEVPEETTTAGTLGVAPDDPAAERPADKPETEGGTARLPATVRPLEEGGDGVVPGGEAKEGEGDLSVSQVQVELVVNTPRIIVDGESDQLPL